MNHRVAKNLHHLPDLRFAKWCEETYSVNRGVYNTIDEKLYRLYHVLGFEDLVQLFFRQNAFLKDKVVDSAACVFCLLGDFRAVLVAYDGIEGGDYAY